MDAIWHAWQLYHVPGCKTIDVPGMENSWQLIEVWGREEWNPYVGYGYGMKPIFGSNQTLDVRCGWRRESRCRHEDVLDFLLELEYVGILVKVVVVQLLRQAIAEVECSS